MGRINLKYLIVFVGIFISRIADAQNYQWNEKLKINLDSSGIWNVDVLGNVYLTNKELLQKYDSIGVLKFSQSQKSIGRISSIQPINTMKVIVFSEEQQQFCILDNTLTQFEPCIDLMDNDIGNATSVVVSAQPDKFWVYDQLNSRLHLLSLGQTNQKQDIENLKGVLNSAQFSFVTEKNYQLFLVDSTKGVYVLDLYGSLVDLLDFKGVLSVSADETHLFLFQNTQLIIINKETKALIEIKLPDTEIIDFKKSGEFFYFRTPNQIKKYTLNFQ